jgi:hypothetical protein
MTTTAKSAFSIRWIGADNSRGCAPNGATGWIGEGGWNLRWRWSRSIGQSETARNAGSCQGKSAEKLGKKETGNLKPESGELKAET